MDATFFRRACWSRVFWLISGAVGAHRQSIRTGIVIASGQISWAGAIRLAIIMPAYDSVIRGGVDMRRAGDQRDAAEMLTTDIRLPVEVGRFVVYLQEVVDPVKSNLKCRIRIRLHYSGANRLRNLIGDRDARRNLVAARHDQHQLRLSAAMRRTNGGAWNVTARGSAEIDPQRELLPEAMSRQMNAERDKRASSWKRKASNRDRLLQAEGGKQSEFESRRRCAIA